MLMHNRYSQNRINIVLIGWLSENHLKLTNFLKLLIVNNYKSCKYYLLVFIFLNKQKKEERYAPFGWISTTIKVRYNDKVTLVIIAYLLDAKYS